MKIKNNIDVKYVNTFDEGSVFVDNVGGKYIILRETDKKKRIFLVLRVTTINTTTVEERSSADLSRLKYIGTAEVTVDIKINNTTGERVSLT